MTVRQPIRSAALGKAKAHRAAMLVPQRAGVIAEQPGATGAAGQTDVLLDGLLRHLASLLTLQLLFPWLGDHSPNVLILLHSASRFPGRVSIACATVLTATAYYVVWQV